MKHIIIFIKWLTKMITYNSIIKYTFSLSSQVSKSCTMFRWASLQKQGFEGSQMLPYSTYIQRRDVCWYYTRMCCTTHVRHVSLRWEGLNSMLTAIIKFVKSLFLNKNVLPSPWREQRARQGEVSSVVLQLQGMEASTTAPQLHPSALARSFLHLVESTHFNI